MKQSSIQNCLSAIFESGRFLVRSPDRAKWWHDINRILNRWVRIDVVSLQRLQSELLRVWVVDEISIVHDRLQEDWVGTVVMTIVIVAWRWTPWTGVGSKRFIICVQIWRRSRRNGFEWIQITRWNWIVWRWLYLFGFSWEVDGIIDRLRLLVLRSWIVYAERIRPRDSVGREESLVSQRSLIYPIIRRCCLI